MEKQLLNALIAILPFEVTDIEEVEENCGTVWITTKNGDTYAVSVVKCEED